jgi:hypothetical protein
MNLHDEPIETMTPENVEEFDVRIFDSRDLVVSIVPLRAPWGTTAENYEISAASN